MEYHLDYKLRASNEVEHENLYKWCIREFDENGEQVGLDQIPWGWSLYFDITDLAFGYKLEQERAFRIYDKDDEDDENREVACVEEIDGKMQPRSRARLAYSETSYSMFGTNRTIKEFGLNISKGEADSCGVWGCVSYTSEIDFVNDTTDDCIVVYLTVTPEKFDAIANLVKTGQANKGLLELNHVRGFYSEWSPAISTNRVKVLCPHDDQSLEIPEDFDIEPPRLGHVGGFKLQLSHFVKLEKEKDDELDDDWIDDEKPSDDPLLAEFKKNEPSKNELKDIRRSLKAHSRLLLLIAAFLFFILLKIS